MSCVGLMMKNLISKLRKIQIYKRDNFLKKFLKKNENCKLHLERHKLVLKIYKIKLIIWMYLDNKCKRIYY